MAFRCGLGQRGIKVSVRQNTLSRTLQCRAGALHLSGALKSRLNKAPRDLPSLYGPTGGKYRPSLKQCLAGFVV